MASSSAKKPAKKPVKRSTKASSSDANLVRELAQILSDTDLTEIEFEKGGLKLKVARTPAAIVQQASYAAAAPMPAAAPAAAAPAAGPAASAPAPSGASAQDNPGAVKSPMVGTAYVRPSPDKDAFVNVGDSVKAGDTVLLIEAMKTFNPIKAGKAGTITQVLVTDAQPVEFGEALFIIE